MKESLFNPNLSNLLNFRPLGITKKPQNMRIKKGLIFRSGTLLKANNHDLQILRNNLKIKCCVDLRSHAELGEGDISQKLVNQSIHWVHFPLEEHDQRFRLKKILNVSDYCALYLNIIEKNIQTIKSLFYYFATEAELPLVISCYAGKDRTGVIAYLILSLLDYPLEEIVYDYQLSNDYLLPKIHFFSKIWENMRLTKAQYIKRTQAKGLTIYALHRMIAKKYGDVLSLLSRSDSSVVKLDRFIERIKKIKDS